MKKLIIILIVSILPGFIFAEVHENSSYDKIPVTLDSGGPDAFGYSWEDSDNGGTVDYNWIDISWTGIPVDGLYDDNVVGPFSIGFDFPYYWYYVDHLWIGSNGYISFSSSANFAHPFAPIPIRSQPNDLLAVLAGDLDFTRGSPSCYYWTNYTDRFIISWIDVGEFGYIDSTHTFQLILDANDSSITFNYGEQHGNFFDSNGEYRNVIGMEDANGEVGLQYLRNNLPAS
ncbi:MAG: hypothetical protein GY855_08035, partial [candidate division Zixibacteria bacterium]|nr:hypothetical protein [candidate division Zixibacteria bacterium]